MDWPEDLVAAVAAEGPVAAALRRAGAPVVFGQAPAVLAGRRNRVLCVGHSARAAIALVAAAPADPAALVIATGSRPPRARRRHLRWWRSLLLWLAADRWFSDSASRLRIYPSTGIATLGCRSHGPGWHDEILVRAAWHGLVCVEIPVPGRHAPPRVRRRLGPPSVLPTALRLLARRTLPIAAGVHGTASPGRYAAALGLGAAIGVSPLIGLHLVLGSLLAWRLRLNATVVFVGTNISFGPLVALWPALAVALGFGLRHGVAPWAVLDPLLAEFRAAEGAAGWWRIAASRALDLGLGSAVQMLVVGFGVAALALLLQSRSATRA